MSRRLWCILRKQATTFWQLGNITLVLPCQTLGLYSEHKQVLSLEMYKDSCGTVMWTFQQAIVESAKLWQPKEDAIEHTHTHTHIQ